MLLTSQMYKTVPNGKKSWRGYINLSKDIYQTLGKDEKEVYLLLIDPTAKYTEEEFVARAKKAFEYFRRLKEAEDVMRKLKEEVL